MRTAREREKLQQEAERRWTRLGQEHPELAEVIVYGRLLVTLFIDELPTAVPSALTMERAREKLTAGIPLLEGEEIDIDLPGLQRFLALLCAWARAQPSLARPATQIEQAVKRRRLTAEALFSAAASGDPADIALLAHELALDTPLLTTLANYTLSAALMGTARELLPVLKGTDEVWQGAHCPICGGAPLLAEFQGSSGERVLRCAICGGGWRILVSSCAHCGTSDSTVLHYLAAEGKESKYRIDLCDRCHGYVKAITSFSATPSELLPIEDAALLHLERTAQARGYSASPAIEFP